MPKVPAGRGYLHKGGHEFLFWEVGQLTSEVELNDFDVRDPDGRFGDTLLVVIVPLTPQPLRLVPHLNEVLVILDYNVVLVKAAVEVGLGPALVVHDVKLVDGPAGLRCDVDTVVLVDSTLAEDDPVEGPVEGQGHFHVALAAHDVKVLDVGHVARPLRLPQVNPATPATQPRTRGPLAVAAVRH